ncbi:MAG: sigma-70 family RNA polymerase sigma factor [Eubacteriales bacterium]
MLMLYLSALSDADADKFKEIYWEYKNLMFYVANKILGNPEDAEDVVQLAFEKIILNFEKISQVKCPQTRVFIVTIVERKAIDLYRQKKNHPIIPFDELTEQSQLPDFLGLEETMLKLPDNYRHILLLRFKAGYSVKEIADILEMKPDNVKKIINRAKRKLAEHLENEEKEET